jgi:glucose-1-phosphate thymidylyltransferase
MKAIIPVAGVGKSLRPHTFTQPKPLILVAGKSIISFILDELIKVGIDEYVFVIGYMGDKIQSFIDTNYPDIKAEYVVQEQRLGLGHAIWTARNTFKKEDQILIVLGDTIFDADLKEMMKHNQSVLGVKKVNDPRHFGVVEFGDDGYLVKVVEKPSIPKSNMAMVGLYLIHEVVELIEALNYIIENQRMTRDEYQLTDALMRMINKGTKFHTLEVRNWFDCGKKDILLETNAILLKRKHYQQDETPHFEHSIIIPPVSIGENCIIENSIIGPNVTIGSNSKIESSIIRESIIGHFSHLEEVTLYYSIVGHDSSIKGLRQSLNIGDHTEIDFS